MALDSEVLGVISGKRPLELDDEPKVDEVASKKPKHEISTNGVQKSPISVLCEISRAAKFTTLGREGPDHAPIFKVSAQVNGENFIGSGKTKKIAKTKAAEQALKSFIQFPTIGKKVAPSDALTDFSTDNFNGTKPKSIVNNATGPKGCLMMMNELYPDCKYECVEYANVSSARFKATITLGNEKFEGIGSRKKLAKNAAASAALAKLVPEYIEKSATSPYKKQVINYKEQNLADYIGRVVIEKFIQLMKHDPVHGKRKVLAGIVMTRGDNLDDAELITVATGTKCISGEYMSLNGGALNDLHAEVIARRCLRVYFFEQLQYAVDRSEESIFERRADGSGFKLKAGIEFHLYINTAPCGDARIFSPKELSEEGDRHPQRLSRGQLRTKIESGEGTIPVTKQNAIQTWDGVLQGERLLTMSCSDKIARWNVLGLQGSLLSLFMDPIYLKSIVLGSLLNETHLYRAICGRLENSIKGLPPPYFLNRPLMVLTTSAESRITIKAPGFSVNWIIGDEGAEVVNTTNGKPADGISRVCKQNMFGHFRDLQALLPSTPPEQRMRSYARTKAAASVYNVAKQELFDAFARAGLGHWIKKPIEQGYFDLID